MAGKGGGEVSINKGDLYFAVSFILWGVGKIPFAIISFAIGVICYILSDFKRAAKRRIKNRLEKEVEK